MADFEFDGDVQSFSNNQVDLIKNILRKHGFKNDKVCVEPVGKVGDNYMALIKRFIVKREDEVLFKMIAKVAPSNQGVRTAMHTSMLFKNEIIMYGEVIPQFRDILESKEVPENERVILPVCHGYLSDQPSEIIVLEDLTINNYKMLDRMKPLQKEVLEIVLKDLAVFHSLSYVLRVKNHKIYSEFVEKLKNFWAYIGIVERTHVWLKQLEEDIISIIEDENDKKLIEGVVTQIPNNVQNQNNNDKESKYSVILHGDCWTNNLMFKIRNNEPVGVVMIDYQISSAGSPATDILYLLFNCTDHKTRSKHYKQFIDLYYSHLQKSLSNFGLNAHIIYPRAQLEADLKTNGKIALGLSLILSNMLCRESDEIFDMKESNLESADIDESLQNFTIKITNKDTIEKIKNKMKDCIDSAVLFGLI